MEVRLHQCGSDAQVPGKTTRAFYVNAAPLAGNKFGVANVSVMSFPHRLYREEIAGGVAAGTARIGIPPSCRITTHRRTFIYPSMTGISIRGGYFPKG